MGKNRFNRKKLSRIASSKITIKQYEYLKNIKNKFNFKNISETFRYLIEQHQEWNSDDNLVVITLNDKQYSYFQNIKSSNEFLTDTETINFFIKIQRAIFNELGSWDY